jgi:hypothetical protein
VCGPLPRPRQRKVDANTRFAGAERSTRNQASRHVSSENSESSPFSPTTDAAHLLGVSVGVSA